MLSLRDAAIVAGTSPSALRHAIRRGRLAATKAGRDWLVERSVLEEYLFSRQTWHHSKRHLPLPLAHHGGLRHLLRPGARGPNPGHIQTLAVEPHRIAPYIRLAHIWPPNGRTVSYQRPSRIIYDSELILILEGGMTFSCNGRSYLAEAGDLLYIPPFVEHSQICERGRTVAMAAVHFDLVPLGPEYDFDALSAYRGEAPAPSPSRPRVILRGITLVPHVRLGREHPAYRYLLEVVEQFQLPGAYHKLLAQSALLRVLAVLVRISADAHPPMTPAVRRAIKLLEESLTDDISVADLAARVGYSPSHLRYLFKRQLGLSPREYLLQVRIARARELLAETDQSVTRIAAEVGFSDPHYFSRLFRAIEGLSPTEYRASLARG